MTFRVAGADLGQDGREGSGAGRGRWMEDDGCDACHVGESREEPADATGPGVHRARGEPRRTDPRGRRRGPRRSPPWRTPGSTPSAGCTRQRRSGSSTSRASGTRSSRSTCRPAPIPPRAPSPCSSRSSSSSGRSAARSASAGDRASSISTCSSSAGRDSRSTGRRRACPSTRARPAACSSCRIGTPPSGCSSSPRSPISHRAWSHRAGRRRSRPPPRVACAPRARTRCDRSRRGTAVVRVAAARDGRLGRRLDPLDAEESRVQWDLGRPAGAVRLDAPGPGGPVGGDHLDEVAIVEDQGGSVVDRVARRQRSVGDEPEDNGRRCGSPW